MQQRFGGQRSLMLRVSPDHGALVRLRLQRKPRMWKLQTVRRAPAAQLRAISGSVYDQEANGDDQVTYHISTCMLLCSHQRVAFCRHLSACVHPQLPASQQLIAQFGFREAALVHRALSAFYVAGVLAVLRPDLQHACQHKRVCLTNAKLSMTVSSNL